MRATRQRPTSVHGAMAQKTQPAVPHVRKVFNCIVDDSALVAGVKRSTRNGIRQWVKNGQIRLFVPLHALDQLSRQKSGSNKHAEDVRETLHWLDDATSRFPNVVVLQGPDEIYAQWAEVEKFVVPRTLFSENDGVDEHEAHQEQDVVSLPDGDMSKLSLRESGDKAPLSSAGSNISRSLSPSSMRSQRSSVSALSPPTSPIKANSSPQKPAVAELNKAASSSGSVPLRLQPLFNYILWRIHQEVDPQAALESFIFLCNDQSKVNYAKGFEIRTKRLEQLREAIGREDRDFKNRQMVQNRENQINTTATPSTDASRQDSGVKDADSDEEVVYKPPPRGPAAMIAKQQPQPNMIDPDAFGRDTPVNTLPPQTKMQPRSPRPNHASPQTVVRGGGQNLPFAPRGNGRGHFRGGRGAGRGNVGRGGFSAPNNSATNNVVANAQIDPNSFTRPRGSGYTGRGGRKLWSPT